MCSPDYAFGAVLADVVISGLVVAAMVLLGVFVWRVIVRTRKPVKR